MKIEINSMLSGYDFCVSDLHCNTWEDVEHLIKSLKDFHRYAQCEDEILEVKE